MGVNPLNAGIEVWLFTVSGILYCLFNLTVAMTWCVLVGCNAATVVRIIQMVDRYRWKQLLADNGERERAHSPYEWGA
jgi:uncharacterized membrane protein